jgi:hypothetical protein
LLEAKYMKITLPVLSFFALFTVAVLSSPMFGQVIIVGTVFEKMKEKGCALFEDSVDFHFKTTIDPSVNRSALYKSLRDEMMNMYPKPRKVLVSSYSEPYGYVISTHRKLPHWDCKPKVFYMGFAKTQLDAIQIAEKSMRQNCPDCVVESGTQMGGGTSSGFGSGPDNPPAGVSKPATSIAPVTASPPPAVTSPPIEETSPALLEGSVDSVDDSLQIVGTADGRVLLLNNETSKVIKTLGKHSSAVTAIHISAGGKFGVSGDSSGYIKFWDLSSGQMRWQVRAHGSAVTFVGVTEKAVGSMAGDNAMDSKFWSLANGSPVSPLDLIE